MNTHYQHTLRYWVAARHTDYLGMAHIKRLQANDITLENVFQLNRQELIELRLPNTIIESLCKLDWRAVDADIDWAKQNNIVIITPDHPQYPPRLKTIPDQPYLLFARGNVALLDGTTPVLSIVGARRATHAGLQLAFEFAKQLAEANIIICSGLALGIDAASHRGALAAQQGKTIAVLGTGLAQIYPRSNHSLAQQLLQQEGLLLSEFLPQTGAHRLHFPRRNRIISGLSHGVLVVEAARKSGSLITAQFALEQGRDVYAIPGSVKNPLTQGCHDLIKEGALLVQHPDDLLQALQLEHGRFAPTTAPAMPALTPQQRKCLEQIDYQPTSITDIMNRIGPECVDIPGVLLALELGGWIQLVPGGYTRY